MAATIEVKYFNSYWLKKIKSIQPVTGYTTTVAQAYRFVFTSGNAYFDYLSFSGSPALTTLGPGQKLSYTYPLSGPGSITYFFTLVGVEAQAPASPQVYRIYLDKPITSASFDTSITFVPLTFGEIWDFNYIPGSKDTVSTTTRYDANSSEDWFIEESRIRGGYNNVSTDLGVKAYIVEDTPNRQSRTSSLIYSGIFNSRTGVNNTNQFSVAEDITKTLDPSQGSIQKLYAEDTNLIVFQELKVSRALIDKDAIYSAEGSPMTTSGAAVIGQVQSYAGNYGISTNPESFAVYGYRKYFTDRTQNAVLRLSQDGITEISNTGMLDYFRDNLQEVGSTGKLTGSWDMHNKQYVLSMQPALSKGASRPDQSGYVEEFKTLSFDEDSLGWTSTYSFRPDNGFSLLGEYYTAAQGNLWKHYSTNVPLCNFYGVQYDSNVTVIFNPDPSYSKTFQTVNYEGSSGWALTSIYTDANAGVPISSATVSYSLTSLEDQLFTNNFKQKENKYFGNIINITPPSDGTVVYGQSMSGTAGFYAIGTFTFPDPSQFGVTYDKQAILFAVSSDYAPSLS
jgi:hypothetical protein